MKLLESQGTKRKIRRPARPRQQVSGQDPTIQPPAISGPLDSTTKRVAKRTVDLALAISLCLFLLPLMLLVAVAIKCVSRGPVLFGQLRLGQFGMPFRMWKFRTMVDGAEAKLNEFLMDNPDSWEQWNVQFKLKDDPRVIPWIGKWMRITSLDELPQLWNVITGEMSLVGPRPLPKYHADQFDDEFRCLRESVPPGITGEWQVQSRNDSTPEMFCKWDTYYVCNWSLPLDLKLLIRTPLALCSWNREQRLPASETATE